MEKEPKFETKESPKMGKIFITGNVFSPEELEEIAKEKILVEARPGLLSKPDLAEGLKESEVYVLAGDEKVDEETINEAQNLKLIIFTGVEPETFFTKEAWQKTKEKEIKIETMEGVNTEAVAEMTSGLILDSARGISELAKKSKEKKWGNYEGFELKGKILGIIGLGRIGARVAEIMKKGYEMKTIYWSRRRKEDIEKETGIEYQSLEEVLKTSDVISLHLALTPETENFLAEEKMKLMKEGAILINASRPGLVNPEALKKQLEAEKIKKAVFDGYYSEGKEFEEKGDPYGLVGLDNFILTPHQGFNTREANEEVEKLTLEIVKKYFKDKQI